MFCFKTVGLLYCSRFTGQACNLFIENACKKNHLAWLKVWEVVYIDDVIYEDS